MQKWRKSPPTAKPQPTTTNGTLVAHRPANPNALRIAIVGMGGVTEVFRNWPERVIGHALVQRGHYVVNIGYHQPKQDALRERNAVIDGITVRRVPVRHWPNRAVYQALDEFGPFDVIHLLHPRNVLAYGTTRWALRHNVPTVYTWLGPFHDRYLIDDRERPYDEQPKYDRLLWGLAEVLHHTLRDGHLRDHLRNYALHYPLRTAKALLPCSEHEANVMRMMGLSQASTVVPLWIDVAHIAGTPVTEPTDPHPTIVFIGQLTPRKGYDLLVQALPEVLRYHPTTTVHVVSGLNEADRAAMEAMSAEAGVLDHIVFRGRVADADLINLLRAADLYVTPTRYEGFGLTLLEAMAAPCAIIASAIPVVNEIVEHGVSGWLVAPDNPAALAEGIVRVLSDEHLRDSLCQGGREALGSQFDERSLICQIERVYRSVCHGLQFRRHIAKIYDLSGQE